MDKELYITDEEQEKCQRVANAFAELYETTDTYVVNAGRYGFVKLQRYHSPHGFDRVTTYTDSQSMFDDLWNDWLCDRLLAPVIGTPEAELTYEELFQRLSKEKQEELMAMRIHFKKKSEGASI